MIFFISSVAETNRAPFDLAEAESELVSGFMTEHAAGIFVFFFLAEYASIILMCMFISIVLMGGYEIFNIIYFLHLPFMYFINVFNFLVDSILYPNWFYEHLVFEDLITSDILFVEYELDNFALSILYPSSLATKTYYMVFLFILVRASYPRLRFDGLMAYC
jgi:NADH-ubiquinone oxidoreductase chain 1